MFQKRFIPSYRVKPNVLERNRERALSKIATKGVVQLFNAVRMQQKDIDKKLEEAGPLDVKRDKVLKNIDKSAFLKVLMGDKLSSSTEQHQEAKGVENNTEKSKPTWSVLRDDFMLGAKLKDWDKDLEQEEETENTVEMEEVESD